MFAPRQSGLSSGLLSPARQHPVSQNWRPIAARTRTDTLAKKSPKGWAPKSARKGWAAPGKGARAKGGGTAPGRLPERINGLCHFALPAPKPSSRRLLLRNLGLRILDLFQTVRCGLWATAPGIRLASSARARGGPERHQAICRFSLPIRDKRATKARLKRKLASAMRMAMLNWPPRPCTGAVQAGRARWSSRKSPGAFMKPEKQLAIT